MLCSSDVYTLINYTSFVESAFIGVSVAGLLYLRYKCPDMPRPIRVRHVTSHVKRHTQYVTSHPVPHAVSHPSKVAQEGQGDTVPAPPRSLWHWSRPIRVCHAASHPTKSHLNRVRCDTGPALPCGTGLAPQGTYVTPQK